MTTAVTISPSPILQFFNNQGYPCVGGTVLTQVGGINAATYQDSAGNTPLPNPIPLNNRGEISNASGVSCQLFIPTGVVYVFTLFDANGNQLNQSSYVTTPSTVSPAQLAAVSGANLIGFSQSSTYSQGTVGLALQAFTNVKNAPYNAKGDGVTDDSAAITAAIAAVSAAGGGTIFFPPGTYLHGTTTLVFKNNILYKGASTASTILKYTGTSDQIQVNNPINSSTAAFYDVEDMTIVATVKTPGKANFADTGSTFANWRRVLFSGAAIGLIFDQTEISKAEGCYFYSHSQAAMWLTNGPARTVGANPGYTNQITIEKCQIDESSTCLGIADDGGHVHTFFDNNFEACSEQIRVCAADAVVISSNEMEDSATNAIHIASTYSSLSGGGASGACNAIEITSNMAQTLGTTAFLFDSGCGHALTYATNTFHLAAAGPVPDSNPSSSFNSVAASQNYNADGGTQPYNNLLFASTWSPVIGGSTTLGTGTYSTQQGRQYLNGGICYFEINLTWTAHTGTGTQILVSLPRPAIPIGSNMAVPVSVMATGLTVAAGGQVVGYINYTSAPFGTAGDIQLWISNAGVLAGLPMAATGTLFISGSYMAR